MRATRSASTASIPSTRAVRVSITAYLTKAFSPAIRATSLATRTAYPLRLSHIVAVSRDLTRAISAGIVAYPIKSCSTSTPRASCPTIKAARSAADTVNDIPTHYDDSDRSKLRPLVFNSPDFTQLSDTTGPIFTPHARGPSTLNISTSLDLACYRRRLA